MKQTLRREYEKCRVRGEGEGGIEEEIRGMKEEKVMGSRAGGEKVERGDGGGVGGRENEEEGRGGGGMVDAKGKVENGLWA